jgi:hypothetical protein
MPIPTTVEGLTDSFRELGADQPELWARSQLGEGIPQLARCSVLRTLWNCVTDDNETSLQQAIERVLQRVTYETTTFHLMARRLQQGVSPQLLNQLVRCVQVDILQAVTYELGGGPLAPSVQDVEWGIFQVDQHGIPFSPQVQGLHESFISLDSTGREGGPREA